MSKLAPSNKPNFFAGDINMNSLDYSTSTIVRQYLRRSETCIDEILTNSFMDFEIMSGIIKTDISDHCAILGAIKVNGRYQSNNVINKGKIYNFKY